MNRNTSTPRAGAALVAAVLAACLAILLGACTTTTTTTTSIAGPPSGLPTPAQGAAPNPADRMTASDEPDAVRRSRARLELAIAYFQRNQMTTALDQVKLAIQSDPNSSEAYNLRGLIYANLGDHQLAEESFRHALQLNPRDADGMHNFGWYLCQRQRYPEADEYFRRALAVPQYRDSPRTLLAQGVCQARAGQLDIAEGTLSRSYELDPGNPATAVNLAEVLYRRGEYERARFYMRRVNSLENVSNAQTLWLAARIENRLGNRQGAQDFGTQLRNRFPESREASLFQRGAFDE
jgi:type IV pilus assembly protein PilF